MSEAGAIPVADQIRLHIVELQAEIHECMSHIACRDLCALEESLWRQETMVCALQGSIRVARRHRQASQAAQTVRGVAGALLAANKTYAELLEHVEDDNRRLLSLSLEYTGHTQQRTSEKSKHCLEV